MFKFITKRCVIFVELEVFNAFVSMKCNFCIIFVVKTMETNQKKH